MGSASRSRLGYIGFGGHDAFGFPGFNGFAA
jgi:hypothetical protein